MSENKFGILKMIGRCAIECGCSNVFTNIATATLPGGIGIISKCVTILGASLMGSMAGEKTADWTFDKIDKIKEAWKSAMSEEEAEG